MKLHVASDQKSFCREILEHYLERIDRFNPELNAIVVDLREEGLETADRLDELVQRGEFLGPLHGVPMTVKESYNVAGTPTTFGKPELKDNRTDSDADSVRKLRAAGVNIFGKTNVPLDLADFQSYNDIYGTTNNPYSLDRPWGSSRVGGVCCGLTGLETGSDIGGSIRNPAISVESLDTNRLLTSSGAKDIAPFQKMLVSEISL